VVSVVTVDVAVAVALSWLLLALVELALPEARAPAAATARPTCGDGVRVGDHGDQGQRRDYGLGCMALRPTGVIARPSTSGCPLPSQR
jgi:hypothetical protein